MGSSRTTRLSNPTVWTPSAHTWVALFRGPLPTTSSCARATDPSTHQTDMSFVDLLLFHCHSLTARRPRMARFCFPHGPKKISEPGARDGGTKRSSYIKPITRHIKQERREPHQTYH